MPSGVRRHAPGQAPFVVGWKGRKDVITDTRLRGYKLQRLDESAPIRGKLRRINIEEATGTTRSL